MRPCPSRCLTMLEARMCSRTLQGMQVREIGLQGPVKDDFDDGSNLFPELTQQKGFQPIRPGCLARLKVF